MSYIDGTNFTISDIEEAMRAALADKAKWFQDIGGPKTYEGPNGLTFFERYNPDTYALDGYGVAFQKGHEDDPRDYTYNVNFRPDGTRDGDPILFDRQHNTLPTALALAGAVVGAPYLFGGGGGLLGSSSAAAGGAEAAGAAAGGASGAGTIAGGSGITAGSGSGSLLGGGAAGAGTIAGGSGLTATGAGAAGFAGNVGTSLAGAGAGAGTLGAIADIARTAAPIIGAVAGAAGSSDQTSTSEREPWKEAQPWLKDLISQGQVLQRQYAANPFNQTQRNAMDESLRLINGFSGLIPAAYQSVASRPEYKRKGLLG